MTCEVFKILADNLAIDATITANRAEISADYSVQNLKHESRAHTARWAAGGDVIIDIVLPRRSVINYFSLLGLNLSLSGSVTFEGFYENNFTDSRLSVTDMTIGGYIPIGVFTPDVHYYGEKSEIYGENKVSHDGDTALIQSARITISSTDEIDLRMLVLGFAETFDRNYSYGHSHNIRGDSKSNTSASGFKMAGNKRANAREISINLGQMTDSDQTKMHRMEKMHGDQSWLFIGRPWDSSSISNQFEMLCFHEKIEFTGSTYKTWNTILKLNEA